MDNLALHAATSRATKNFIANPGHALAIAGAAGIGKASIAKLIAAQLLRLSVGDFESYPYARTITSIDGKAIGIEAVRELEHFLSLKVPGTQAIKRIIIINDGHLLTIEAQNALLKTLEEPPIDTVIILTTVSLQILLPTIQSRLQTITVTKPTRDQLITSLIQQGISTNKIDSVYAIAGGLPGLTSALLADADHPLLPAVRLARLLLSQTPYQRLLQVDDLAKDKTLALNTLTILMQMAHISLQTTTGAASAHWKTILNTSYKAAEALQSNGQAKIVLTNALTRL